MSPTIHTLPSPPASRSLQEEIELGLIGTADATVPGSEPEDVDWSFKRSVPTLVLYDEQGLRLYDGITAHAPEYYLFPDELNLLKTHGDEIARCMGFPGRRPSQNEEDTEHPPSKPWKPARWGDYDVGKWNEGVNGEEGMGWKTGWDVVELGAGALRKTAHLLTALSSALPPPPHDADRLPPPITFHPLDLSLPELDRVLSQMDDGFGDKLAGKVACIGLHGDYHAGLQCIRDGKLSALQNADMERGRRMSQKVDKLNQDWTPTTPEMSVSRSEPSPPFSPATTLLVTPMTDVSPLPSVSDSDKRSTSTSTGTWSPIEDTDPILSRPHSPVPPSRPLHLVFLGSSLGNFPREDAAPFLKSLPLRPGDTFLIGLDGRPQPGPEGRKKVEIAYNDPAGYTKLFEEHGWDVVREELGLKGDPGVEFVGRYNEKLGRHEAYFKSKERQTIRLPLSETEVTLEEGELLNIEWSYKYSYTEAIDLFDNADLRVINSWKAPDSEYRLWLLERPVVQFNMISGLTKNVPQYPEWEALWKLWDHITLEMIPKEMLHKKPIDLRHICLFYLGHIPTFLDIFLTRMIKGKHTEPEYFKDIFERGIDPCVDDPTQIHPHSEVPKNESDWPSLDMIVDFRDRVRQRLQNIYSALEAGEMEYTRHIGRTLFMTYEHEAMHAETLLYMLIQSSDTRPPTAIPQWDVLASRWSAEYTPSKVLTIQGEIEYGHDDLEAEDASLKSLDRWADHEFGWDNEHPRVKSVVRPFKIETLPITNNDYLNFLGGQSAISNLPTEALPASWVKVDTEWKIRTLYGSVGFETAGLWPLAASKVEIDAYAKSKGGRLPTETELRLFWAQSGGARPAGDLANIGFKNWHPIPPCNTTADTDGNTLHGHNGGLWEWTDTPFKGLPGFVPSVMYPGYSSDFFDDKHYTVLGGSFATVPGVAGRQSFRNFYQANYRFAFVGGRVAYDA